mgnify:CR=1 FL=1
MADEMINSYVALDLETTGIGARQEKITEIGMVKVWVSTIPALASLDFPYAPILT